MSQACSRKEGTPAESRNLGLKLRTAVWNDGKDGLRKVRNVNQRAPSNCYADSFTPLDLSIVLAELSIRAAAAVCKADGSSSRLPPQWEAARWRFPCMSSSIRVV